MLDRRSQSYRDTAGRMRRVGLVWLAGLVLVGCGSVARLQTASPPPVSSMTTPSAAPSTSSAERPCADRRDRAPAASAAQEATAVDVRYDDDSNTITLRGGEWVTLTAISRAVAQPQAVRESTPGEWLLSANLVVERSAALRIAAPEVRRLKLRSDDEGFIAIKVLGGRLEIVGTCVTSWDSARNTYDQHHANGRSFVLARDGARMDIRGAELSYLGYDADQSYGVAWRLAGTTGELIDSYLGYNFYGLYTYEASDLVIRGNEVHHSVRYGIDPHTRSNRLLIERNVSHHNGKHGIILAETCDDNIIRNNTVYANALHGIVIYQRSNNNLVEGNTSYANGQQGINVNDSTRTTIRDNTVYDNAEVGIGVGQDATDTLVEANRVHDNREDGIFLYSGATKTLLQGNTVSHNARYGIYVKSAGNQIGGGNQIFGNTVGVYLNADPAPDVSREANRIYDNREADVRSDAN